MPLLAAIDIGSNSAQLLISRYEPSRGFYDSYQALGTPRLGEGLSQGGGKISPASLERLGICLDEFAQIIRNCRAQICAIVLTEAVRNADNPLEVLMLIQEKLNFSAQIITGTEEAQLAYLGVRSGFDTPKLCSMDIGAGSIELGADQGLLSLPIGALRMAKEFGAIPSPAMDKHIKEILKAQDLKPYSKCPLVISGGTALALAMIYYDTDQWRDPRIHQTILEYEAIEEIYTRLATLSEEVRSRMAGLGGGRSGIILPGIKALMLIAKQLKSTQLILSDLGLKHGLILKHLNTKPDSQ